MQRLLETLATLSTLTANLGESLPTMEIQSQFMTQYTTMLKLSLLSIGLLTVFCILFFGYGLYRVYHLLHRKVPLSIFFGRLAVMKGIAVLAVLTILTLYAQSRSSVGQTLAGMEWFTGIGAIVMIGAVLFVLFLGMQYLDIPLLSVGKAATKALLPELLLFVFFILIAIIGAWLLQLAAPWLWLEILFLLALIPFATILRVMLAHGIRSH